jgi:hypothetical protein
MHRKYLEIDYNSFIAHILQFAIHCILFDAFSLYVRLEKRR